MPLPKEIEGGKPSSPAASAFQDAGTYRLGFTKPGDPLAQGVIVTSLSQDEGGKQSVCGKEVILVEETVKHGDRGVHCAAMAILKIGDSPVHYHEYTTEYYFVLEGQGRMVLGEAVVEVKSGNIIAIAPGQQHGLMSVMPGGREVTVLIIFSPGLAPINEAEFRDETLIGKKASELVKELSPKEVKPQ